MITMGAVSRDRLAEDFPFLAEHFRGRRKALKELTHQRPDFVFWILPDGGLHDARNSHADNVPRGYAHAVRDYPDYGGLLRGRIVTSRGRQLIVVYCRSDALTERGTKLQQFLRGIRQVPVPVRADAIVMSDNADIYGTLTDLIDRQQDRSALQLGEPRGGLVQ